MANDRQAAEGDFSERRRRTLAAGRLKQPPDLLISFTRNADQRRFDVTPDLSGPTRIRVCVIVSPPIQLGEGAPPIRHVLIFDDHPATIRLLAQKRENKLALVKLSAPIVLLLLAMFWRLL